MLESEWGTENVFGEETGKAAWIGEVLELFLKSERPPGRAEAAGQPMQGAFCANA